MLIPVSSRDGGGWIRGECDSYLPNHYAITLTKGNVMVMLLNGSCCESCGRRRIIGLEEKRREYGEGMWKRGIFAANAMWIRAVNMSIQQVIHCSHRESSLYGKSGCCSGRLSSEFSPSNSSTTLISFPLHFTHWICTFSTSNHHIYSATFHSIFKRRSFSFLCYISSFHDGISHHLHRPHHTPPCGRNPSRLHHDRPTQSPSHGKNQGRSSNPRDSGT